MTEYGIKIVCDRCGREDFLESVSTGYSHGIAIHNYRKPDEGWTDIDKPGAKHLCPMCNDKYKRMIDRFYSDPDWDCGVVLETCVKNSISDICISPEELAEASARAAEAMKRMVGG